MMPCPLPIDWLEYLEGAHSEELISHLPECRPCQLLVEELRRERRPPLRPSRVPDVGSWRHWCEIKEQSAAFGEIWWTIGLPKSLETAMTRVPVLVLSNVWHEKGSSWCEVAPLSTDFERATSLDLILRWSETDMEVPWRVLLRYQTIAELCDLDTRMGKLTEEGHAVVQDALAGLLSMERFGSPIEGDDDPRVELPEPLDNAIRELGRTYACILEPDNNEASPNCLLTFELRRFRRPAVEPESLSLAAESAVGDEDTWWVAEIPNKGRFGGRVEHRFGEDELLFQIEDIIEEEAGLSSRAWLTFWSRRLPEPVTSQQFLPGVDRCVLLGRDLAVLPREITRLELRLLDEG
jgi:hypothetical protein